MTTEQKRSGTGALAIVGAAVALAAVGALIWWRRQAALPAESLSDVSVAITGETLNQQDESPFRDTINLVRM